MVALGLSEEAIVAAVRVQTRQVRVGSFVTSDADHGDAVTAVTTPSVTGVTKRKRKGMTGAERMAKCRAKKAFQARQGAFDFEDAVTPEIVTEVVTVRDGDGDVTEIDLPSPKKVPLEPPKNTPLPSQPPFESASQPQSPAGGVSLVEQKLLAVAEEIEAKVSIAAKAVDRINEEYERNPPSAKRWSGFALSADWKPRPDAIRLANTEYGLSPTEVETVANSMRDYALTNRSFVKFDWDATFWDWIKRYGEKKIRRDSRPANRANPVDKAELRRDDPNRYKGGAAKLLAGMYRDGYRSNGEERDDPASSTQGEGQTIDGEYWTESDGS